MAELAHTLILERDGKVERRFALKEPGTLGELWQRFVAGRKWLGHKPLLTMADGSGVARLQWGENTQPPQKPNGAPLLHYYSQSEWDKFEKNCKLRDLRQLI